MNDHAEKVSDGINFAWYLSFWLARFGRPECEFWRTMTPARCNVLYAHYVNTYRPASSPHRAASGGSLSRYLMGGGG